MQTPQKLFNRNFLLLWQGQFVSQLGNQAHAIALMFWLKHTTESAGVMGLIMMLSMLPGVILGPFGGTFADRYSRKRIIIYCDLLSGVAVLSLAMAMFLIPQSTGVLVVWAAVMAVFMGILSAVFRPAISASIPDLVPKVHLTAANSFNQGSYQVAGLVGQGTGGVLFRILGAPVLFLIDGITFIFSAFCASFIQIPQKMPEKAEGFRELVHVFGRDMAEGVRYIWQRKGMRNLFLMATVLNFFMSPFAVLLPFYIEDHLHATSDWFGYFLAAIGGGAMIGFMLAGAVKVPGKHRALLILGLLFMDSLAIASLGLARNIVVAVAIGLFLGMLNAGVNINIVTILQITTPSEIRGRVFGFLGTIAGGLMPIGMGLAGVVADFANHNIPAILVGSGLLVAVTSLLVGISRETRAFLSTESDVAVATQSSPESITE